MARDRGTRSREESLNCVRGSTERTSDAFSLLFQSWMHLGSQIAVGSTRIVADTLEDLNDLYCNPRGGPCGRGDGGRGDGERDDRRPDPTD